MSKPIDDGGRAFPGFHYTDGYGPQRRNAEGEWEVYSLGMTLRQWYAGQAMKGLLANPGGPIQANGISGWALTNCKKEDVAGLAYDFADAMIAHERAEREAQS